MRDKLARLLHELSGHVLSWEELERLSKDNLKPYYKKADAIIAHLEVDTEKVAEIVIDTIEGHIITMDCDQIEDAKKAIAQALTREGIWRIKK